MKRLLTVIPKLQYEQVKKTQKLAGGPSRLSGETSGLSRFLDQDMGNNSFRQSNMADRNAMNRSFSTLQKVK